MTDFEEAMKELASVEHSNDNSKVLHKNSTELGLTFWGIYQSALQLLTQSLLLQNLSLLSFI
jgi:hypothetical protein